MYRNPLAAAREIERNRIPTVAVTNLPSHYQLGKPHIDGFHFIRSALGLHPLYAKFHAAELELFDELSSQADYIGEVGLDFSREGLGTRDLQISSFSRVLDRIVERRRFVTVHSRAAEKETLALLRQHRMYSVVFHWYSGTQATLAEIVGDGHYLSVNPAMAESVRGRRLISIIPKERLLSESDGPYVRVGSKAASPKHIGVVHETVASIWNTSPEEVETQILANFGLLKGRV
jgi:TatD DNase family protein